MAYQSTKPPKTGTITAVLNMKNIGIDDKTLMLIDDRLSMVQEMNLLIGENVQYRQLGQGPDKGKINFIARSTTAPAQPKPAAAEEPESPKKPPREPRIVSGEYITKTANSVTIKFDDENHVYPADLSLVTYLSKPDTKVHANDIVTVRLIDSNGVWVAKDIGPGPEGFKSGKDILQENLDEMAEKKKQAEEALAQIKKEEEEAAARIKENAEYAAKLAAEKQAKEAAETQAPINPPNQPEIVAPEATAEPPAAPAGQVFATGGVELGIHINLGNYSSFDLKVTGISGDHARQLLRQEAAPTIALVKQLVKDASKGY